MKKILSGIFTAAFIAAITFTSCSSPSGDNQFSFDDFEPAALPQFQGVNPLTGKTFTDNYFNLTFTNNKINSDYDYSIDTTNNLIYVRYSKSYILSYLKPQYENIYAQCVTTDQKEYYNEIVIDYFMKSYYSKISCIKYSLQDNTLTLTDAYVNQTNQAKEFQIRIPDKYSIGLRENYIWIETYGTYPHNQYWSKLSNLDGSFYNTNYLISGNSPDEVSKKQGTFAGTISITTAQDPTQSKCTIKFTQLPSEIPDRNSLLNTPLPLTPFSTKFKTGTYTLQQ